MSCPCSQVSINPPVTNCTDCPPPTVPCANGELCEDVFDAGCVQYSGPNLPNINVTTNMRVDQALQNINQDVSTQAISVNDTNTVTHTGSGLSSNPLTLTLKIDPNTANILTQSSAGAAVLIDVATLTTMMNLIAATPALQAIWCQISTICDCDMPSGGGVVMS